MAPQAAGKPQVRDVDPVGATLIDAGFEELEPAERADDPGTGNGVTAKQQEKAKAAKTTYVLFEEVQAVVDGKDETVWLPLGEYAASSGGSALGHHFSGLAMPEPSRTFHAVPARSSRKFHPPEPNPVASFREGA